MPRSELVKPWMKHLGVALAYALCYAGLREVSFPYWVLFSGFRLSALLLVPRRYWPAMAAGEMIPLGYTSLSCLDEFGWVWSVLAVVPPVALAMPAVRLCQDRWRLFPARHGVRTGGLLICALLVSAIWTAANVGTLLVTQLPPGYVLNYADVIARWMLGNDLGVLTVVPLALLLSEAMGRLPARAWLGAMLDSRFVLECVSWMLPALVLLAWIGRGAMGEDVRQAARMAMFLPVAVLVLRHGWHAVAIGGAAASLAVVLTIPADPDANNLEAEVFICFAISTMLLLGGRITALNLRDERERADTRKTLALAKRALFFSELRAKRASETLEQIRGAIRVNHFTLLERVRQMLPSFDQRFYLRQGTVVQEQLYRVADNLYPVSWGERGLPASLREGAMARTLDESGVRYFCTISGRGLSQLSSSLHLVLYRVVIELVYTACQRHQATDVRVELRGGYFGGRRWAVLRVDAIEDPARRERVMWNTLLPRLAAMNAGVQSVHDQVELFEGRVRERRLPHGGRVSLIFHDH